MRLCEYSRLLSPALYALLVPSVVFAQKSATFNIATSNAQSETPANIYAVDVNNDGLTDIVSDGGYSPAAIYVSLNKGNGTFAPPVQYLLPANNAEPMCIAAADYNRDGRIDLVVPLVGTDEIAVYPGNGDGTFSSPILSTVNLQPFDNFTEAGCAAADFNGDGNLDLAAWGYASLYIFQGEGNGSFSATAHPTISGSGNPDGLELLVGDYNGDGKADLATDLQNQENGTTIHVLYGNNDFTFADSTPYTYSGNLMIGSGDLNSDGITDLYALTNYDYAGDPQQLGTFYGTTARTFSSYWSNTTAGYIIGPGPSAQPWIPELTVGDFNGDGRMDLAAAAYNYSGSTPAAYFELFLAGSTPGQFSTELVSLPASYDWSTYPVAGLLSGSYSRPDLTKNDSNNGSNDTTPTDLTELLNTTSGYFGLCSYPKSGRGFHVCAPGVSLGNEAGFSAAADSFGKLRKIELWVDGRKVQEQDHTWDTHAWFDWVGRFSNGRHRATFYAYDVDNTAQRYDFTFVVSGH